MAQECSACHAPICRDCGAHVHDDDSARQEDYCTSPVALRRRLAEVERERDAHAQARLKIDTECYDLRAALTREHANAWEWGRVADEAARDANATRAHARRWKGLARQLRRDRDLYRDELLQLTGLLSGYVSARVLRDFVDNLRADRDRLAGLLRESRDAVHEAWLELQARGIDDEHPVNVLLERLIGGVETRCAPAVPTKEEPHDG